MFLWFFSGGSCCQVRGPTPWRSASGEKPVGRGDTEGDQRPGRQPPRTPGSAAATRRGAASGPTSCPSHHMVRE